MSDNSAIEWTDTTWNPVSGCDRVSPGCDHCYALTLAKRLKAMGNPKYQQDGSPSTSGPGFGVTFHEDALTIPAKWRKPRRVFVSSMGDLFHDDVYDHQIARVFAVMAQHPQHTFQVLTKRHARMRALVSGDLYDLMARDLEEGEDRPARNLRWPLPNVWLGVSVESQQWADIRIPALLDTPAAVRFLSCEPLLGPVDLRQATRTSGESQRLDDGQISWVIAGGESGPSSWPAHPDWFRSLRDDCTTFDIPFFFKQWGEWAPTGHLGLGSTGDRRDQCVPTTLNPKALPREGEWLRRVGKKVAGRELDGRTWDEFPAVPA